MVIVACALGVEVVMAGAGAEARGSFVKLEERALPICGPQVDLLRFSTPILRRLVERGRQDAAGCLEPIVASGVKVKIAPVRRKGMGCGRGAGKEKANMKVLGTDMNFGDGGNILSLDGSDGV